MAFDHISFNDQTNYGRMLRRCLTFMEEGDDLFRDVRSVMIKMCENNDPTDANNFIEVTSKFGFATNAKAKAAFDEIDSAYSKTSGDASVSNVRAARDQLFDKLRG
jgi:hypothetical protein